MTKAGRLAVCVIALAAAAAAAWAQGANLLSIPVSGRYWEPAAGGWLNYGGIMTLTWSPAYSTNEGYPVSAKFVGQAWCMNTGAAYTLYGYCADCISGRPGESIEATKTVLAIDGQGQPAFSAPVTLAFAIPSPKSVPSVSVVAFGGR